MSGHRGFYRVKVEDRDAADRDTLRKVLVLHVYRDGVEAETHEFELSESGSRSLIDEVRWLEWRLPD